MLKKYIVTTLVGIIMAGVSSLSFASYSVNYPYQQPSWFKRHLFCDCGHTYVTVGTGAYYLRNADVDVGTVGTSTAPLSKINNNGFAPLLNLHAGYNFYNNAENRFTKTIAKIFGRDEAFDLKFNYFNTTHTERKNNLGAGQFWYINGDGSVLSQAYNLYNFRLRAKHRLTDVGLYFRGTWLAKNPAFAISPFVGLVYTNFNERYSFSLDYDTGLAQDKDKETYKIDTNYYGVAMGGTLGYTVIPKLTVLGQFEGQLLHANASLHANQYASAAGSDFRRVHNTDNKPITYRAIGALGVQYAFTRSFTSPSVALKVGLDQWGYNPTVIPPNNSGSRSIYITGESQTNSFVSLEFNVPIA